MEPARFVARQLANPSGVVGATVLPRLWNRRNVALNDAALAALALEAADRVLEVGVGGGYLLGRLAPIIGSGFLAGVDISPAMISHCRRRHWRPVRQGRLGLTCASVDALPLAAGQFDKACSVNSIFYWPDAVQALTELWRVLVEGGLLVLCFTTKAALQTRRFAQRGLTLFESDEVSALLKATGFGNINVTGSVDRWRGFVCVSGRK